jgi:DNA-directed RNA polymerase specialized sigma24 family protein
MEREVVLLRFFGERSYGEIASILDKREDAVRQHIARALRKMRSNPLISQFS